MGIPGIPQVGAVSVKVTPDTNRFREKLIAGLKKEMTPPVKVEVPVDLVIDKSDLAKLLAADKLGKTFAKNLRKDIQEEFKNGIDVPEELNLGEAARNAERVSESFGKARRFMASIREGIEELHTKSGGFFRVDSQGATEAIQGIRDRIAKERFRLRFIVDVDGMVTDLKRGMDIALREDASPRGYDYGRQFGQAFWNAFRDYVRSQPLELGPAANTVDIQGRDVGRRFWAAFRDYVRQQPLELGRGDGALAIDPVIIRGEIDQGSVRRVRRSFSDLFRDLRLGARNAGASIFSSLGQATARVWDSLSGIFRNIGGFASDMASWWENIMANPAVQAGAQKGVGGLLLGAVKGSKGMMLGGLISVLGQIGKEAQPWFENFSGLTLLKDSFQLDMLRDLPKHLPKIAALSSLIGGVGLGIGRLITGMLSLLYDLGRMTAILLPIPGIVAGIATNAFAAVRAFKDINKELPFLSGAFERIGNSISTNFWDIARGPMTALAHSWLPLVKRGMDEVAVAQGAAFGALADSLREIVTPALPGWFSAAADFARNLGKYSDGAATAIKALGDIGAYYLPKLGTWLGEITTQFGEWLTGAIETGEAFRWVDDAIGLLKDLWRLTSETVSLFATLGSAAREAGSGGIAGMADWMGNLAKKAAESKDQITALFRGINDGFSEMVNTAAPGVEAFFTNLSDRADTLFPQIGRAVGTVVDGIATVLGDPAVLKGIEDFFGSIERTMQRLEPAFADIANGLGEFATFAGEVLENIAGPFAAFSERLGRAGDILLPTLSRASDIFSDALTRIIEKMAPIAEEMAPRFADALDRLLDAVDQFGKGAGKDLLDLGAGLAVAFGETVLAGIERATDLLGGFNAADEAVRNLTTSVNESGTAINEWVTQAVADFDTWADGVNTSMETGWNNAMASLSTWLTDVGASLAVWWEDVTAGFGNLATNVGTEVGKIGQYWSDATAGIRAEWELLVAAAGELVERLVQPFRRAGERIASDLKASWETVKRDANAAWGTITSDASRMWEGIKGAIKGVANRIVSDAKQSWDTIKRDASTSWGTLRSDASRLWSAVGGAIKSALSTIARDASASWRRIKSDAISFFSGAGGWLVSAGRAILSGLVRGIEAGIGAVRAKLQSVTRMIPDWKGPYETDRKLLTGAGEAIMQSLVDGFEVGMRDVRRYLNEVTTEIGSEDPWDPLRFNAAEVAVNNRRALDALDPGDGGGDTYQFGDIRIGPDHPDYDEARDAVTTLRRIARANGGN